jgi:biopolymer transport protein ExbD
VAFSFGPGNGGGGGRGSRFRNYGGGAMADINIIPLVDVVLVLLIIFMVTAHVMEFGLEINVPKVSRQPKADAKELPVVSISKDGNVYLADKRANYQLLRDEVRKQYPNATAVYVRADGETHYEPIAQVISILGEGKAGQPKYDVRLVTQPMDAKR